MDFVQVTRYKIEFKKPSLLKVANGDDLKEYRAGLPEDHIHRELYPGDGT